MRPPRQIFALLLILAPLLAFSTAFSTVQACSPGASACPMMRMSGCQMRACCHVLKAAPAVAPAPATPLFMPRHGVRTAPAVLASRRPTVLPVSPANGFPRSIFHPPLG